MAVRNKKMVKGKPVQELTVRLLGLRVSNLRDDAPKSKPGDKVRPRLLTVSGITHTG